ncbi:hypothetical protein FA09DRAFT_340249 [Tilletiopsis washingtonensis]|uniref:Myb-like domain-containing protein n=1 Tax=Tilletiopsis washingtonensis TaxID=58919 RepID=A0A316Z5W2_9BASI|nr:hypothetical protein FA09DRAFT_340249 [Tilletiopsis washingtonensis]PWN96454.1 hypothetical protein FA09DRAFT_340249 [Tilletiopsis washingtonensis]
MPPKRKADESNGEAKPRVKKAKSEASGDSAALKKGPWSPEDHELAITCILSLNPPKMSKEQLTAIGQVVGRDATAMSNWWRRVGKSMKDAEAMLAKGTKGEQ